MERFFSLLPPNLYSHFTEFRYKVVVYPIMITYYLNKDEKYDESEVNKKIKKLSKSFSEFISRLEENDKLQTTILNYFKETVGPELQSLHIGISCNRLFKSKMPYYRNFSRITKAPSDGKAEYSPASTITRAKYCPCVMSKRSSFETDREGYGECRGQNINSPNQCEQDTFVE